MREKTIKEKKLRRETVENTKKKQNQEEKTNTDRQIVV